MTTDHIAKLARDLTEILDLATHLEAQAIHNGSDKLMPGGHALVALAPVASPDDWLESYTAAEYKHQANPYRYTPAEELGGGPEEWEAPLQTLLQWSERYRDAHGYPRKPKPTLSSEISFLKWCLDWAYDQPTWDDLRADIKATRTRLESLLHAGSRPAFTGAPCMYDECRGKRLIRTTVPARDEAGNKVWRLTDWHCPSCKRQWDEESYTRNVYAAIERTHWHTDEDGTTWGTVDRVARRLGRPEGTIRAWVSRGQVGDVELHGRTFVNLEQAIRRDALARARAIAQSGESA